MWLTACTSKEDKRREDSNMLSGDNVTGLQPVQKSSFLSRSLFIEHNYVAGSL